MSSSESAEVITNCPQSFESPVEAWGMKLHYLSPKFEVHRGLVEMLHEEMQEKPYRARLQFGSKTIEFDVYETVYNERNWDEGRNLLFVAEKTSIPVPRLLAVITMGPIHRPAFPELGRLHPIERYFTFTLTTVVPGKSLFDLWVRAGDSERRTLCTNISAELKGYLGQLREIEGGTYIGSLDHRPVASHRITRHGNAGPFAGEREFHVTMKDICKKYNSQTKDHMDRTIDRHKHDIVFTHGMLNFKEIMIQDGHISGIIRWCYSGWYPSYWEWVFSRQSALDFFLPLWEAFWERVLEKPHPEVLAEMDKFDLATAGR